MLDLCILIDIHITISFVICVVQRNYLRHIAVKD